MPEITLSFNASDDDGVTLRSLEFLSLFDLSDGQQYSLCISGDFCSLTYARSLSLSAPISITKLESLSIRS